MYSNVQEHFPCNHLLLVSGSIEVSGEWLQDVTVMHDIDDGSKLTQGYSCTLLLLLWFQNDHYSMILNTLSCSCMLCINWEALYWISIIVLLILIFLVLSFQWPWDAPASVVLVIRPNVGSIHFAVNSFRKNSTCDLSKFWNLYTLGFIFM